MVTISFKLGKVKKIIYRAPPTNTKDTKSRIIRDHGPSLDSEQDRVDRVLLAEDIGADGRVIERGEGCEGVYAEYSIVAFDYSTRVTV